MKKKIIYIILAFFAMGCDMQAVETPVVTTFPQPEPVVVTQAPKEILPLVSVPVSIPPVSNKPTTQPQENMREVTTDTYEPDPVNEDEQLQNMIAEKIKIAYAENRSSIITLVIKWICIFFGFVIVLYWLIRLLNLFSSHRLGFTLVWSALFLLAIILALTVL